MAAAVTVKELLTLVEGKVGTKLFPKRDSFLVHLLAKYDCH